MLQEFLDSHIFQHALVFDEVLTVFLPVSGEDPEALAGILVALMAKVDFFLHATNEIPATFALAAVADLCAGAGILLSCVSGATAAEYTARWHYASVGFQHIISRPDAARQF